MQQNYFPKWVIEHLSLRLALCFNLHALISGVCDPRVCECIELILHVTVHNPSIMLEMFELNVIFYLTRCPDVFKHLKTSCWCLLVLPSLLLIWLPFCVSVHVGVCLSICCTLRATELPFAPKTHVLALFLFLVAVCFVSEQIKRFERLILSSHLISSNVHMKSPCTWWSHSTSCSFWSQTEMQNINKKISFWPRCEQNMPQ